MLIVGIFGSACFAFWQKTFVLNFLLGYVCFLLISIANFFSLKNRIKDDLQTLSSLQQKEKKKQRFSHFILGLQISGSLFRILAYSIMIASLFCLMYYDIFVFSAYAIGIGVGLLVVVVLQFLNLKRK